LQVFHLLSSSVIVTLVGGGLGALAVSRLRRRGEIPKKARQILADAWRTPGLIVILCVGYAIAAWSFAGSFTTPIANVWDDFEAYFVYPKSLLALGALEEPFSYRRLATLGGQSYLQAFLLPAATVWRLNGFDNGICLLSIVGMLHGYTRRHRLALAIVLL